jgi:hypothetical protein
MYFARLAMAEIRSGPGLSLHIPCAVALPPSILPFSEDSTSNHKILYVLESDGFWWSAHVLPSVVYSLPFARTYRILEVSNAGICAIHAKRKMHIMVSQGGRGGRGKFGSKHGMRKTQSSFKSKFRRHGPK